jgi:hypothetical protein
VASAPGHVANVRHHVFEALSSEQVTQLAGITDAILDRLDPDGVLTASYQHPTTPADAAEPDRPGSGQTTRQ